MLVKSPLKKEKKAPNLKVKPGNKNLSGKLKTFAGSKGMNTGGHLPHGKRKKIEAKGKINLPSITPWKVILTSFLIGICGILYITHVFSLQQSLQEVQQLENEFNQAQRIHVEQRLAYDRMVGPKEIYHRAQEQGFINAGPADQVIILKK